MSSILIIFLKCQKSWAYHILIFQSPSTRGKKSNTVHNTGNTNTGVSSVAGYESQENHYNEAAYDHAPWLPISAGAFVSFDRGQWTQMHLYLFTSLLKLYMYRSAI